MLTEKDAVKRLFLCPGMDGIPQGARKAVRLRPGNGPYVAKSHGWRCDECPGMDGQVSCSCNSCTSAFLGGRIPQGARTAMRICQAYICLAAAILISSSTPAWAESACSSEYFDEITNVRYVHDGDTLHLSDGRKVRLIGVNTPELARDNKAAEAYAIEAKNALRALFEKNKAIALVYGKDKKDRYGRLLAHTFLTDGQNVQALLLAQGYASTIIIPPNTKFAGCYLEAENTARCNKSGLWQTQDILQASQLENRHIGFHLLRGTVESIAIDDKGIWLNLDNRLTVGIRPENRALFDIKAIEGLLNQSVVVRGWVNKSNRTTPFYLRLKHPLSLQTASALNCH